MPVSVSCSVILQPTPAPPKPQARPRPLPPRPHRGAGGQLPLGWAVADPFFLAQGKKTGTCKVEKEFVEQARQMLANSAGKIVLPVDTHCGDDFKADCNKKIFEGGNIADGWNGFDIGPKSVSYTHLTLPTSDLV